MKKNSLIFILVLVGFLVNVATSNPALKKICETTDHQQLCFEALDNSSITDNPMELMKLAFKAVIKHIQSTSGLRSGMKEKANDNMNKAALSDCDDLLQYAVDELQASISEVGDPKVHTLTDRVNEIKNWLGAVISYQETCKDGITQPEVKSAMEEGLLNATQLTSNALAIVSGISGILSAFHLPSNFGSIFNRVLVEEDSEDRKDEDTLGYPTWLRPGDRKLLALQPQINSNVKPNVVVAQDGSGNFKTINEALNAMPKVYTGRYVIYIKAGTYIESVLVTKDMVNVFMYGDGPNQTVVSGSKNWIDGTPTFQTATFAAIGQGFIAKDMGFENTAGPEKHQAVALRVQSDMSAFYNCRVDGYQDTLYAQTHRQFYRNCVVSGTVDFIFGDSSTLMQNCLLLVRRPSDNQFNIVTAHGRKDKNEDTGLVIQNCRILPDKKLFEERFTLKTYLGRPWKEYSRTVVMESLLGDFIQPEGWKEWEGNFALDTLVYNEYGNTGPGANTNKRVQWKGFKVIDRNEAQKYTAGPFLQGETWLKETGAPYILGLEK